MVRRMDSPRAEQSNTRTCDCKFWVVGHSGFAQGESGDSAKRRLENFVGSVIQRRKWTTVRIADTRYILPV